jgi:hypothetical protein
LRAIVGNGSIRPSYIYRPIFPVVGRAVETETEKPARKNFRNPLVLLTYPDIIVLLVFNATLYSVFYAITATISTLFEETYPFLNPTDIGLCFLAIGGGMIFGTTIGGKLLDFEYQVNKRSVIKKIQRNSEDVTFEDIVKEDKFPIERARLRVSFLYSIFFIVCTIGYGWCLQAKVSLAGTLIMQIISEFETFL